MKNPQEEVANGLLRYLIIKQKCNTLDILGILSMVQFALLCERVDAVLSSKKDQTYEISSEVGEECAY